MFDETNKNNYDNMNLSSENLENNIPAENNEAEVVASSPKYNEFPASDEPSLTPPPPLSFVEDVVVTPTSLEAPSVQESVPVAPVYENPIITPEPPVTYASGTAYTKTVDGTVANGYEWGKTESVPALKTTPEKKKKIKSDSHSEKGFRVFLVIILSVFALSILTMSAAVAYRVVSMTSKDDAQENTHVYDASDSTKPDIKTDGTSRDFNYDKVVIDNKNYVDYEFDEHNGEALSIPEVAAKCTPSTVGIVAKYEVSYNFPYYIPSTSRMAEASGSGFIYSSAGYIITNHHVIENATEITVVLYDGSEYDAELIGSDALSDVAVLKITPAEDVTLIPIEIGDSDKIVVGEQVVAIGCPAGIEFIGTVTDGIISAINRDIELTDDYGRNKKTMTLIQTNATINHGNSGGPLINTRGQVIGINTLKLAEDYEGIGFSIPINGAVAVIEQLIEHGKVVERPEEDYVSANGIIGINGSEITEDEAEYYEIPVGILVIQIDKNSPAAKAGLRRGDIITHYNGIAVSTVSDINAAKGNAKAGDSATVTVYRIDNNNNGNTFDITFTLMAEE